MAQVVTCKETFRADYRMAAKTRPAAPRPAPFNAAAYAAAAELDEDCDEDVVSGMVREDDDDEDELSENSEVVEILDDLVLCTDVDVVL